MTKSDIARALAALRKTHGGPKRKCSCERSDCKICRQRRYVREPRARAKAGA